MKTNYSKLLTTLAGIAGFTSFNLLITLPSDAKSALNPNPSIFNEAPYNQGQRLEANASPIEKGNTKRQQVAQQSGKTNPRPSIFNEPPYNRGGSATPSEPTPRTPRSTPETQPTETPTTTPPGPGATDNQGKNLLALAESNASFTTLTKALKAAGLTGALQGKDNLTIFAPTDAAFAKLPQDALQELLKPDNKEVLLKILTYHVVSGKVLSTDLKSGEVKSLEGGAINVKVDPATGVTVNDAKVTQADITGSNGVIHAIDQVILPPDL
ncbi:MULTISPECIES: fasciclin domain-containing protein [Nostoc]|uniref:Fasciclin domain-containing protein n=2 Tax=Nostoc TaxID=1177 RepID=A0ABR8IBJ3_9NOSO|nr:MULTISPECIES: fasciclin domain-containing protein [Nostoc]MBD2562275.1 fasciclin domain-containing protein [Nostoc linckia FACHB-391]MBD2647920.1 fasciclin domain-containing protein [Nostoc foliaceum FACHB-393]MBG1241645.1 fasciclin domain-containing protein [Nostoc sp. NZL]MBG1242310.1 fasciclin domain-containing protein [Nostoc sp. NZL]